MLEPEFSNFVASLPIHSKGSSLKSFYLEFGVALRIVLLFPAHFFIISIEDAVETVQRCLGMHEQ